MKNLILVSAVLAGTIGAMAQGTINFNNRVTAVGLDQPVTYNGAKLDGAAYLGQLYVGATAGSLAPVGVAVEFRGGAAAGYINGGTVTLTGVAAGSTVFAEVRAWEASGGNTYELAVTKAAAGKSETFQIVGLGGPVAGQPDAFPANMTNFKSFSLVAIPEPSTVALGLLGAVSLLAFRRK